MAKRSVSPVTEYLLKTAVRDYFSEHPNPKLQDPESVYSVFNPSSMAEYIGQPHVKELCGIMMESSKISGKPFPNTIFDGDAGLGKTTIAKLVLKELDVKYKITDGATANRMDISMFRGYVIIDEIHNLDPQMCDSLNTIIDRNDVHIIGATTELGKLPKPFRSRFRQVHLTRYTDEDISEIVRLAAVRNKSKITKKGLFEIAKRSRNTPRLALNYLANVFEYSVVKGEKAISVDTINRVFTMLSVDDRGLTQRDYDYLDAIPDDRSVGLQYIAARISVDEKTIEEEVEPYLMQLGLVDRTNRGRKKVGESELMRLVRVSLEELDASLA